MLGNPNLDDCYTGLTENQIRLIYPGTKVEARLKLDPVYSHVVVYAPSDEQGKPKDYVAVEPALNANNGFNLLARGWEGSGVHVLEPGEEWGGFCELSWSEF